MRRLRPSIPWLLIWAALAAPACAGLDRSIEKMMGRDARAAIEAHYRLVETPAVVGFVDRVGQRVAASSPRQLTYTFRVIETDEVNAMALPSGDFYVTTGLLEFVESQDELAGVLAHEIAHVAAKHSLRSFKKQFWAGILFGAVKMSAGVEQAGRLATTLYFLRYSRKDEADADKMGAEIALAAGYDPFGLQRFMERLGEAHKGRLSSVESWFTTHPEPERRVSRLGELKELDPSRVTTLATIGQGYLDRHFAGEAVLRLRRAETLAPEDARVQLLLAQASAAAGLAQEAARHAAKAAALDPGLAQQAPATVQAPASTQAPSQPEQPAPADVDEQAADSLKQVEASRQAAKAAAQALATRLESVGKTRKQLAGRTEQLGRDVSDAARTSQLTGERQRMLVRAASVLKSVEEVVGRLGGVARASAERAKEAETAGGRLAERLQATSSPAEKARLLAWADRYVADVARRETANDEISREAEQALATAGSAAEHLDTAIEGLSRRVGLGWSSDELALNSARTSLDAAEEQAKQAGQHAKRAGALQSESAVRETAWGLDMDALALPPAEQARIEAIAAGYLGGEAQAVRAASEEAGGLGAGVLRLIAQATPASGDEKPEERVAAQPEHEVAVDVLLTLMRRDIKREIAAAKRAAEDPNAQEPTGPDPPPADPP